MYLGIDGYKAGWVGVLIDSDCRFLEAIALPTAAEIMERVPDAQVIAIDIPIGLPEGAEARPADIAARAFLKPAASTVFTTPCAETLRADTYREAVARSQAFTGKGISKQSYALRGRIFEVADLVETDDRIVEVHPEVCFRAMADRTLPPKKTWAGLVARLEALRRVGLELPDDLGSAGKAAPDDVLDAAAAALTARRYARGEALSLPGRPNPSPKGQTVAIWY